MFDKRREFDSAEVYSQENLRVFVICKPLKAHSLVDGIKVAVVFALKGSLLGESCHGADILYGLCGKLKNQNNLLTSNICPQSLLLQNFIQHEQHCFEHSQQLTHHIDYIFIT